MKPPKLELVQAQYVEVAPADTRGNVSLIVHLHGERQTALSTNNN